MFCWSGLLVVGCLKLWERRERESKKFGGQTDAGAKADSMLYQPLVRRPLAAALGLTYIDVHLGEMIALPAS